jgi:hypothetical protein
MKNVNARTVGYWAATGLLAAAFFMGGAMDLAKPHDLVEGMSKLGYPLYFMTILGTWKVLGAAAIVAPKTARLKEWAYAGMVFDLTGAAASHLASGDPANKVVAPLVLLGLVIASWSLRPASRMLGAKASSESRSAVRAPLAA